MNPTLLETYNIHPSGTPNAKKNVALNTVLHGRWTDLGFDFLLLLFKPLAYMWATGTQQTNKTQVINVHWYFEDVDTVHFDLATLLVYAKTVAKSDNVTKCNDFM